jgi:predicted RNase H-like HicB family nuclease
MNKVNVIVEYSDKNLSAYIEDATIITTGKDLKVIKENMNEAIELYLESCKEMKIVPVPTLQGEIQLDYKIDAATFINYYSGIFTKAALSRITGINERQLWHYAAGIHKPRKQQLEKIQNGINALTKELTSISLL